MEDFKSAFMDGLKAARDAEIARKEIGEVFNNLNIQLAEVSKGKIRIERRIFEVERPLVARIALSFEPPETYLAIAAVNPTIKDSQPKELAKWQTDIAGYPCQISWGSQVEYCEDKQALERCLANLLRDAVVAERLDALMKIKATEKEN